MAIQAERHEQTTQRKHAKYETPKLEISRGQNEATPPKYEQMGSFPKEPLENY